MIHALLLLVALQQEIPDHPDKLKYPSLKFEVPDAGSLRSTLAKGTVVYAAEDPTLPLVHLQIQFRGGSFHDPKGKEGLADLWAAVLRTGGTKGRDPQALDEELDFLAAEFGISAGELTGSISLSLLAKDLDRGLAILDDVLRFAEFRQEKLDLARAQMLDRIKARNDSTGSIEKREANLLLYGPEHPSNRLATRKSLESITREDLIEFHKRFMAPEGMIVAAAGNFSRADLVKKLDAVFSWESAVGPPADVVIPEPNPTPGVHCFNKDDKNITQGRVTMGHVGIRLDCPDLHAIRIMNYIYGGGGFSSRLTQRVRTDEGLAYDVDSSFQPGIRYVGTFRIQFQSKTESCAFAMQLCLEELKKMQEAAPDAKVVDEAKKFFIDGFPAFFFSTKFKTVQTFATAELNGYPKDYYKVYRETIAAVTPADVQRVAKQYMKPEKLVIVCVGNIGAMVQGDGKHKVTLSDFGPVKNVPLPDPETMERTK
ncbi:MAG: insulinase family protein [Planctomycetes bacterium]|nr:insulinase family protein [Planctomycetota bacterium]